MKYAFMLLLAALCCTSFKPGQKKSAVFTLKKFDKKMALVQPCLLAGKFEVSNLEYRAFLTDLAAKGQTEKLVKARIHVENWSANGANAFTETYHAHPAYDHYPVVNVSQEGARLFCEWLTGQYNASPKRAHRKVKFRLPAEEEWKAAACAGNPEARYPWRGNYLRSRLSGAFQANFRLIREESQKSLNDDGLLEFVKEPIVGNKQTAAHVTALVESFSPNDLGIFNIAGNVSEMLAYPGRTKGGCYRSFGYYLCIDAEDKFAGFTEPSPLIGFRYFMEVVEE